MAFDIIYDSFIPIEINDSRTIRSLIETLCIRKFIENDLIEFAANIDPADIYCRINEIRQCEILNTDHNVNILDGKIETELPSDSKIEKDLKNFLKNHSAKETITHTSISGGSYNIPNNELPKFYSLYSKVIENNKLELDLTECHISSIGPICIEFNFLFNEAMKPRPINKILLKS